MALAMIINTENRVERDPQREARIAIENLLFLSHV